jgi:hypothetical protein
MQATKQIPNRNIFYIISFTLYAGFLFLITQRIGIITINEAEKYITAAENFLKGDIQNLVDDYLFYFSYIFFVATIFLFGNTISVIIFQAVFSFFAAICIKRILDHIQKRKLLSSAGMLFFLFCYPIQVWTVTLFSESFFISISVITLYYCIKTKSKVENYFFLILCFILVFSRPPGIFLSLPFFMFFLLQKGILSGRSTLFVFLTLFIGLVVAIFYIPAESKGYIRPIAAGRIIVDSSDYNLPGFQTKKKASLITAYEYLSKEKGYLYIVKIYFQKIVSFFKLTRSYYSKAHNLLLWPNYILYILAFPGLIHLFKSKEREKAYLFSGCILGIINLVGITYNEWHYRFTVTIFPFLIILAIINIAALHDKYLIFINTTKKKNEH